MKRGQHGPAAVLVAILVGMLALIGPMSTTAQDDDEIQGPDRFGVWEEIPEEAVPVEFEDIVDGDTIEVVFSGDGRRPREETVRMIGIDTPEVSFSYGNEPECYGEQASRRTESMLLRAEGIWLEEDVDPFDDFDRLLRYVWFVSEIDGEVYLLNEVLVREGYAEAKTYRPNTRYQEVLDEAEEEAIRDSAGMWLSCDASVSGDPDLEDPDAGPDDAPIDRTAEPVADDEEAACSFFNTFDEAQEFLAEYPDLADILDPDADGLACEGYFGVEE